MEMTLINLLCTHTKREIGRLVKANDNGLKAWMSVERQTSFFYERISQHFVGILYSSNNGVSLLISYAIFARECDCFPIPTLSILGVPYNIILTRKTASHCNHSTSKKFCHLNLL